MIDPFIFERLQQKIDDESAVRDELHTIVKEMSKKGRLVQSYLSRSHSTPTSEVSTITELATPEIIAEKEILGQLASAASKHPFYLYNHTWSRELQNLVLAVLFCAWLGGLKEWRSDNSDFMTYEEVGKFLNVPVNTEEDNEFHLTLEEYLLALTSLIEELSRLAINSVTFGDYARPFEIKSFISDLHDAFQLLNLKNDILRKRVDALKYSVKKVEDVVYDLSLRNLIPKSSIDAKKRKLEESGAAEVRA